MSPASASKETAARTGTAVQIIRTGIRNSHNNRPQSTLRPCRIICIFRRPDYSICSILDCSTSFVMSPTLVPAISPPLKKITVGIDMTP